MFILLFDISIGKGLAVMGEKSRKICDQIRPVFFSELLGKRFPLAKGRPLSSLYRKHYGPLFSYALFEPTYGNLEDAKSS